MPIDRTRRPAWFVIVAVILLLWAALGCFACLQQLRLGAEAMGPSTPYDRQLYASLPGWYDICYAVGVVAGLAGAIALLVRSAVARPAYIVSLVAVVIQFGWMFAMTDIIAAKGAGIVVPFPIFIAAIGLFAVWLSSLARHRGWIG